MQRANREIILKAVENVKSNIVKPVKIRSSEDGAAYARNFYFDDIQIFESAFIILMNSQLETIGWAKVAQGAVNYVSIDVKIFCKFAIDTLASAVMFVHNHPSGVLRPSEQDDKMTKRLKDAMEILGIRFLDSIILTKSGFYSYNDNGRI